MDVGATYSQTFFERDIVNDVALWRKNVVEKTTCKEVANRGNGGLP